MKDRLLESMRSVLPIIVIVTLLSLTMVPLSADLMYAFLIGSLMIVVGMGLFTLGAEFSLTTVGNRIGSALTKSKNIVLILVVSFLLGVAITIAEPDLQVLAETVPHIDNAVLLVTVGVGVGFFLAVCMLRIILGIRLRWLLLGFYILVFALAAFTDPDYLGIAFDSGGVTTGPMTVPVILALGVGVSNIRSDENAESDSFGLVALCSIGPILAVLLLGFFYQGSDAVVDVVSASWANTVEIGRAYFHAIPNYIMEVALSLSPIVIIFVLFQLFSFKLSARPFLKICLGMALTYVGLVLFLSGVNVGFSSLGVVLGGRLAGSWMRYLMIPLAMLFGWFIISAEPAVYVLEKQIEEVSSGAIPGRVIKLSLSISIALAMGIAMLRVLTGISILWFLVPGYILALGLSFFVPDIFTAIAFDSGGVASGPMTATFMMQFMIGASSAAGGNVLQDAFGIVAIVAMMPLICVQVVGLLFSRRAEELPQEEIAAPAVYEEEEIIELWEVPG